LDLSSNSFFNLFFSSSFSLAIPITFSSLVAARASYSFLKFSVIFSNMGWLSPSFFSAASHQIQHFRIPLRSHFPSTTITIDMPYSIYYLDTIPYAGS
jgi:hypothetical protein